MSEKKKVALVLAGGGVTGVVFEIGVLRALNEVWLNRTVNELDLYVGTSAGSYVAAHLASGIPAARMYNLMQQETSLFGTSGPSAIYFPNISEVVEKSVFWPITLLQATGEMARSKSPIKGMMRAAEAILPSGLLDTWMMQHQLYRTYRQYGKGNRFDALPHPLHIIATDLDTGERTVFNGDNPVPLEKAVAASCAIPLLYRPVRINGREYVDGGVRGTASIDLAVEEGADLIIVVNSLVPYQNHPKESALEGTEPQGHVSGRGPLAISNQVSRASVHGGLLYHIKHVKREHPHVNIMLIEPPAHESLLSFRNMMSFLNLNEVLEHGFEVGMDFWRRNESRAREVLAQRDIRLATRIPEAVPEAV